jgi:hypothetical protein
MPFHAQVMKCKQNCFISGYETTNIHTPRQVTSAPHWRKGSQTVYRLNQIGPKRGQCYDFGSNFAENFVEKMAVGLKITAIYP